MHRYQLPTPLPLSCDNQNCLQTLPDVPWGPKSSSVQNHCFRWNVNILDTIWNIQGGMTLDWRCKHVRCKIKLSEDSKSALCLSVVSIRLACRILCNAFPVHFIVNTFTEILRYSINNSHVRSRQVNLLYVGNCLL
jgi:hypothetical protein